MALHWSATKQGKLISEELFEDAELPEVPEDGLEDNSYTNQKIASMCATPELLRRLLEGLPEGFQPDERRSILCATLRVILSQSR